MAKTYTLTLDKGEAYDLERIYNVHLARTGLVLLTCDEADTLFLLLHALVEQGYKPTLNETKKRLGNEENQ